MIYNGKNNIGGRRESNPILLREGRKGSSLLLRNVTEEEEGLENGKNGATYRVNHSYVITCEGICLCLCLLHISGKNIYLNYISDLLIVHVN